MKLFKSVFLIAFAILLASCSKKSNDNISEKWELVEYSNGWGVRTINIVKTLGYTQTITTYSNGTFKKERKGGDTNVTATGKYRFEKVDWGTKIIFQYDNTTSIRDFTDTENTDFYMVDASRNLVYDGTPGDGPMYKYKKMQ